MESRFSPAPKNETLSVEVTTHCNSTCSHCFVRARGPRKWSLAPDLVQNMIGEAHEAGYKRLHITGGEPLLWNGLLDVLDYAFALGYETAFLNTNGTLLSNDLGRKFAAHRGLAISISLHGPRQLHDRVRGKGFYDKALKGIYNAIDSGLPVHVFTPVGRSLIPQLPRYAEELFSNFPDIEQLNLIQLIRVPGDIFDLSEELLRPSDFLAVVRMVALLNLRGLKIDFLNNPLANVASKVLKMRWLPRSPPLYQSGSILITAEKRVTLAHSTMDDFGVYEPGILSKIIRSAAYRHAVSPDRSTCEECVYARLCSMDGMLRPSEWNRDMFPQVPYCKRVLVQASSYG